MITDNERITMAESLRRIGNDSAAEYHEYVINCRKALAALDGQTIVLPDNIRIEVIECNGDKHETSA